MDDLLNHLPENYCILEERVDLETQMAYFKALKETKKEDFSEEATAMLIADLNSETTSDEDKKEVLLKLAGIEEVSAYRAIENFYNSLESCDLKSWAAMAIQESRMLIQSQLMDEQQVFIASGLGGKGQKLRYFVAALMKDAEEISSLFQEAIKREFQYTLEQNDSILEQIRFEGKYALMTVLIPLKKDLRVLFKPALEECSNLGILLNKNLLITNVKELEIKEIEDFVQQQLKEGNAADE